MNDVERQLRHELANAQQVIALLTADRDRLHSEVVLYRHRWERAVAEHNGESTTPEKEG